MRQEHISRPYLVVNDNLLVEKHTSVNGSANIEQGGPGDCFSSMSINSVSLGPTYPIGYGALMAWLLKTSSSRQQDNYQLLSTQAQPQTYTNTQIYTNNTVTVLLLEMTKSKY